MSQAEVIDPLDLDSDNFAAIDEEQSLIDSDVLN